MKGIEGFTLKAAVVVVGVVAAGYVMNLFSTVSFISDAKKGFNQ